ncbi:MAG: metal ABC transporter permease [Planctomycetota bacterium]
MSWNELDTWIVVSASLVAVACALPGVFLLLSRQSMMAHGIAHSVLPGIVIAHLVSGGLETPVLLAGAVAAGLACAALTRALQNLANVEPGAALGIAFTSLFAVGLTLQRLFADHVHIEPSHVLYGNLETSIFEVVLEGSSFPAVARRAALGVLVNAAFVALFFKELRAATFDPEHGASVGARPHMTSYLLMASSAFTCVVAFEAVGSILVVAMMILPPAFASLFAGTLRGTFVLSLLFAVGTSVLGHVVSRGSLGAASAAALGFEDAGSTNTAGGIAVTAGAVLALGVAVRAVLRSRSLTDESEPRADPA